MQWYSLRCVAWIWKKHERFASLLIKMACIDINGIQKWIYHFNRCKYLFHLSKNEMHDISRPITKSFPSNYSKQHTKFLVLRQIIRDSINYKFFSDGVSTKVLQRAMQWLWKCECVGCVSEFVYAHATNHTMCKIRVRLSNHLNPIHCHS